MNIVQFIEQINASNCFKNNQNANEYGEEEIYESNEKKENIESLDLNKKCQSRKYYHKKRRIVEMEEIYAVF